MAARKQQRVRAPTARMREKAEALHERMAAMIPDPHVELHFGNPWQLLVAVILSAQSTDKMVNKVMPELLKRWPTAAALGAATQAEVEEVVRPTGFFRNKAKAIRETSRILAERFGGQVPRTMEEMLELPGVARKTANVVLGAAYGVASGIPVDVHAARVSQRLGLTKEKQPEKIEQTLCALFPQEEWIRTGHRLVLHGRHVCTARAPRCEECPLNELCPSREAPPKGTWRKRAEAEAREMESRAETFHRAVRGS
ncbi:MAG: endonuclease III [Myxococcaceae bacterium]|nr:endonuclease III [Myxococcaceae bacterium]